MKKLKEGIIGYGVGEKHALGYKSTSKCRIIIFDKDKKKKKKILEDGFEFAEDESEFFKNKFDIISIASYDKFHFNHILKSTNSTNTILCEKPICNNIKQLKKINKLIKSKKIKLTCNFVLRTVDLFKDLKKKIKSNFFGDIFYMEGSYLWSRINKLSGWRANDKDYSFIKGASIHMIDLLCWLIGSNPTHVYACGNRLGQKTYTKKNSMVSLSLEFKNNLYIKINAFGPSVYPHYHEIKIFGSKATSINEYKNNFFIKKKNKHIKIKNFKNYPDHLSKKNIIKNLVNSHNKKKIGFDNQVFSIMNICFAAEKSLKLKKRVKINYLSKIN